MLSDSGCSIEGLRKLQSRNSVEHRRHQTFAVDTSGSFSRDERKIKKSLLVIVLLVSRSKLNFALRHRILDRLEICNFNYFSWPVLDRIGYSIFSRSAISSQS